MLATLITAMIMTAFKDLGIVEPPGYDPCAPKKNFIKDALELQANMTAQMPLLSMLPLVANPTNFLTPKQPRTKRDAFAISGKSILNGIKRIERSLYDEVTSIVRKPAGYRAKPTHFRSLAAEHDFNYN